MVLSTFSQPAMFPSMQSVSRYYSDFVEFFGSVHDTQDIIHNVFLSETSDHLWLLRVQ